MISNFNYLDSKKSFVGFFWTNWLLLLIMQSPLFFFYWPKSLCQISGTTPIARFYLSGLSLGSTVFYDLNQNGRQDFDNPLEKGIQGVKLVLIHDKDGNGIPDLRLDSIQTDLEGNYLFSSLQPGYYQIELTPSDDAPTCSPVFSKQDDGIDGDSNGQQLREKDFVFSPIISLQIGTEPSNEENQGAELDDVADTNGDMTIDFGMVPNMSIGSTIFYDFNNNGIHDLNDPLETGIPDVLVLLLTDLDGDGIIANNEVYATTRTNNHGNYLFDTLPEGEYCVVVKPTEDAPRSSTDKTIFGIFESIDGHDNGIQTSIGTSTFSQIVILQTGTEPTSIENGNPGDEQDDASPALDANGDMTVDFGFVPNRIIGSIVLPETQGSILTSNFSIPNLVINLFADADFNGKFDPFELVTSSSTNRCGEFTFSKLKTKLNYLIDFDFDSKPLLGVSTLDLIAMQKHILGIKPITNPYLLIAADLNNSQSITLADLILLRRLILHLDDQFTRVPNWKLVRLLNPLPDSLNPWSQLFYLDNKAFILDENSLTADFIAIKMGDINGDIKPRLPQAALETCAAKYSP